MTADFRPYSYTYSYTYSKNFPETNKGAGGGWLETVI